MNEQNIMIDRKADHLSLAQRAQMNENQIDKRFDYEPLFHAHPDFTELKSMQFLGKNVRYPLWISSMTGGTKSARLINQRLAQVANEFGLGMGLGSCRSLLDSDEHFEDFNLRPQLGDELPFYANLGIAQVEDLLDKNQIDKIEKMLSKLRADGLIIHVNPLQEWFQPEGDKYKHPPIETIERLLAVLNYPIIVKEVGQGFGPRSLETLIQLPLAAIEFGAFGGTNFSKLELLRNQAASHQGLCHVGHTAEEMVHSINLLKEKLKGRVLCENFIISGGVKDYLDGMSLVQKIHGNAVYGHAKNFLEHADSLEGLRKYVSDQIEGIRLVRCYLHQTTRVQ